MLVVLQLHLTLHHVHLLRNMYVYKRIMCKLLTLSLIIVGGAGILTVLPHNGMSEVTYCPFEKEMGNRYCHTKCDQSQGFSTQPSTWKSDTLTTGSTVPETV